MTKPRRFRVLVCGGRDYTDSTKMDEILYALQREHGPLFIISGGATGADFMAERWAKNNDLERLIMPARWNEEGKKTAGPRRNQRMLDDGKPDLVVAFPGGTGTADMVRRAKAAKVKVKVLSSKASL